MEEIKVICCDIDGTLLKDDKTLSEENRLWISKSVREKGIKFVIVSGRILRSVRSIYDRIGVSGPASCLNGTFFVDEYDNVLASHKIDVSDALKVVEAHEECKVQMLGINENTWYTEERGNFIYKRKLPMYMQEPVIINQRKLVETTAINKFVFMSENKADLNRVYEVLNKNVPAGHLSFYPGKDFLEVMTGGITKGTAVDDLIEYYKVDRNNIMALGDDVNDVEMIQKAGLGIAMGNALDFLKQSADDITDTNMNDGVAKAIRKYVF